MKIFIEWSKTSILSKKILELQSYETLKLVFIQNFEDINPGLNTPPELIKIATGKGHICSPHETDARYSSKGGKGWIGYKSQVAETVGEEVNFITYIESTDSTDHDSTAIRSFIQDQEENDIVPSEIFGDTHYNTENNIENLMQKNIELKGPVAPAPNKETVEKNQGFSLDENKENVICPRGIESKKLFIQKDGKYSASFPQDECLKCERMEICQPEKRGKQVAIRFESDILKSRRELMTTDEFKKDMHQRNGIEGTISGLVRGQGMRRSRYRGMVKSFLQNKFIGASANISRLHRYNEIIRKREQLIFEQLEDLLAA
jgi:hypothetical protein